MRDLFSPDGQALVSRDILEAPVVYKLIQEAANDDFESDVVSIVATTTGGATAVINGALDGYDIPTRVGDGESSVETPAVGVRAEVA